EKLAEEGISVRVFDLHTIKPLDEEAIVTAVRETGCIVTAEEHQVNGGMGGAVAEVLAKRCPAPMEMVAVQDSFGESGQPQELMDKYGLNRQAIEEKVKAVLARK
ncbi:MAG: transketolase family protein, partial [Oscillospiraceae bacterium]|nr:transketolase family protein [Oscillospiraceae bacterium]